jgi:hypothetical protein
MTTRRSQSSGSAGEFGQNRQQQCKRGAKTTRWRLTPHGSYGKQKHMEVNMEITCDVATVQDVFVNISAAFAAARGGKVKLFDAKNGGKAQKFQFLNKPVFIFIHNDLIGIKEGNRLIELNFLAKI